MKKILIYDSRVFYDIASAYRLNFSVCKKSMEGGEPNHRMLLLGVNCIEWHGARIYLHQREFTRLLPHLSRTRTYGTVDHFIESGTEVSDSFVNTTPHFGYAVSSTHRLLLSIIGKL